MYIYFHLYCRLLIMVFEDMFQDTDMRVMLILFLYAHLLSFLCFLISSFATQMCLCTVYGSIVYAFCTATPTDSKQVVNNL